MAETVVHRSGAAGLVVSAPTGDRWKFRADCGASVVGTAWNPSEPRSLCSACFAGSGATGTPDGPRAP